MPLELFEVGDGQKEKSLCPLMVVNRAQQEVSFLLELWAPPVATLFSSVAKRLVARLRLKAAANEKAEEYSYRSPPRSWPAAPWRRSRERASPPAVRQLVQPGHWVLSVPGSPPTGPPGLHGGTQPCAAPGPHSTLMAPEG